MFCSVPFYSILCYSVLRYSILFVWGPTVLRRCALTAWQTLAYRVWLMPPTKTPLVSEMWKQRLTNMCQDLRLTRTDLQEMNHHISEMRLNAIFFCLGWSLMRINLNILKTQKSTNYVHRLTFQKLTLKLDKKQKSIRFMSYFDLFLSLNPTFLHKYEINFRKKH